MICDICAYTPATQYAYYTLCDLHLRAIQAYQPPILEQFQAFLETQGLNCQTVSSNGRPLLRFDMPPVIIVHPHTQRRCVWRDVKGTISLNADGTPLVNTIVAFGIDQHNRSVRHPHANQAGGLCMGNAASVISERLMAEDWEGAFVQWRVSNSLYNPLDCHYRLAPVRCDQCGDTWDVALMSICESCDRSVCPYCAHQVWRDGEVMGGEFYEWPLWATESTTDVCAACARSCHRCGDYLNHDASTHECDICHNELCAYCVVTCPLCQRQACRACTAACTHCAGGRLCIICGLLYQCTCPNCTEEGVSHAMVDDFSARSEDDRELAMARRWGATAARNPNTVIAWPGPSRTSAGRDGLGPPRGAGLARPAAEPAPAAPDEFFCA